ncbi:MAG: IS3 family transposase [Deltaproteobacteria bacterium]|nr:IS3 family transposase [Deltaproteobacteria bacterium]
MKFAFIQEQRVAFPVAALCRLLGVSTSGFYASVQRKESRHSKGDAELARRIHALHVASGYNYGSPRIHADLKASGQRVARKRVARLMRQTGLKALTRRRFKATTDSKHGHPIAPNLLQRDFTAAGPNRAWVTDISVLQKQRRR